MKIKYTFHALIPYLTIQFLIIAVFISCRGAVPADPPNPQLVSAHSGGTVDRHEPIRVEFTADFDTSVPLSQNTIKLSPTAKGTVSWENSYTLLFTPSQPLKSGTNYTITVNPSGFIPLAPQQEIMHSGELILPELKPFSFTFASSVPTMELKLDPVKVDQDGKVLVTGTLIAEKSAEISRIERTLSSRELGRASWTRQDGEYRFSFAPLAKQEEERTVTINWNGRPIGVTDSGSIPVIIPGNRFDVSDIRFFDNMLEVVFSAPLKSDQNLQGFMNLSGNTRIRYSINENIVRIYGIQGANGGVTAGMVLNIQDLPDAQGNILAQQLQFPIPGKWEVPELRFGGRGTILPTSQGSQMVIETKNLAGVLVEAFQIHGSNMIQFLQVNPLDGTSQLERVGEPVWTQSYDLSWRDADKNVWKRHGLDLSELARKYPDGMFHIRLSFRHRHIRYECEETHADFSHLDFPPDFQSAVTFTERSNWDLNWGRWDNNWFEMRKDPCHPAFYSRYWDHNITVSRNVLVSDLGLMAKRGEDGSWILAVSNIRNAMPEANVAINVLNFQGRSLYQIRSDSTGLASFSSSVAPEISTIQTTETPSSTAVPGNNNPAFLFASGSSGRAWLRIGDSQALTVSHFDIAGGRPASGLRGLIYGERGVWRPGDDIFLTFLLSDPANTLPANHPVSFELEDPRGRISAQRTYTSSVDGFYPIGVSTPADAPTGDWIARVRVGGSIFTRNVKIETIIPNRLSINLDFGPKAYIERNNPVTMEGTWLYGAPAGNLNADISVSFSEKSDVFPGHGDFIFTDPSRTVSGESQRVWEGRLDEGGKANFTLSLDPGRAVPGKLNARFMTRLFEPSGIFSTEHMTQEFSPYERYVGIRLPRGDAARNMLLTDTNHRAEILLLDPDGNPLRGNAELECAIYKLDWRWWWERGGNEAAEFAAALSTNPIMSGTTTVQNGRGSWDFQVNYPEWGRYMVVVRDRNGHSAANTVYIDWPGWAGRATEGAGQGAAAMLTLSPDKTQYQSGERVSISFPSNREARAFVTLEKGGNVIKQEWIRCEDTITRYEFTAEASMVPNIYVHVSLIQPHLQTQNDLPLRLYGITPVMIEDPRTHLVPVITAAENWQPETDVSFTISESSGRAMAYTVVVVDEGLLGLTRFSLPNPRSTFYAREASFVRSWDLFADVIGAFSGRLETLLAIGGGDDLILDGNRESQRFRPIVRYFGPYELRAGERRTESFTLPQYIGALRIMVLAASSTSEGGAQSNRAYGTAERQVRVSSDLMVFGTVPRTLSMGDEAVIPVTVASYRDGARNVDVNMELNGASLLGQRSQRVSFDRPGEQTIYYRIKAPDTPGLVHFTFNASSPALRNARHITDLAVRSTAHPVTTSQVRLISPNESWTGNINFPGMDGTNSAILELSRLPPLNLESRLNQLIGYPHGCIEQITSILFPQLYLDKVMELNAQRMNEIRTNITAGIERLAAFQIPDGGFAYWPGAESAHDWASTYAGHFLLEARRAGYTVPQGLLSGFIRFQKSRAALWASADGNQAAQAYRLYTLALAGEADLGSMNRLRERQGLEPLARWRLAAAYWYAGQRDTARNVISGLGITVSAYRELGQTFGSAFRDRSIILETLTLVGGSDADARTIFEDISTSLSANTWFSTQETAHALRAAMLYMQGSSQNGDIRAEYSFGANSRNTAIQSASQNIQVPLGNPAGSSGAFSIRNLSGAPVYARISVRGTPAEGREQPLSNGLSLSVEYRNDAGAAVNPAALRPGQDMIIRVTVANTRLVRLENIALVHLFPASWEIINERLGINESTGNQTASRFDYQDIRDDRVMTYFNLDPRSSITVSVRINNTYDGNFFRPAIHAYAMYDESIAALIPGVR